jgi:hypothetical protein
VANVCSATLSKKPILALCFTDRSMHPRYYDLPAVDRFVGAFGHSEGDNPEAFLREEVRVEAVFGSQFRKGHVFFTGVAFWHWVAATGNTHVVKCDCEQEWRLSDFSQRSSLTLYGSMGVHLPFSGLTGSDSGKDPYSR